MEVKDTHNIIFKSSISECSYSTLNEMVNETEYQKWHALIS